MNKMFAFLGAFLSLLGCGHSPQLQINGFETQVSNFEIAAQHNGYSGFKVKDLIINIQPEGDVAGEDLGQCTTSYNTTPVITIAGWYWQVSDDNMKEVLLFHEMGHCVLGRSHKSDMTQGLNTNGTAYIHPYSIMYPISTQLISDETWYQENHDALMKELF